MKLSTKLAAIATGIAFTAASFAAAPWSPAQQHRHHQVHRMNHKIARQQRAAQRAFWNGNLNGAFRHAQRAQNIAYRKQAVKHQIRRSNRHWARNHPHCGHGLYC